MINGETRFGGLIGRDISFSLSPLIHNASAQSLGLNVVYLPFEFSNHTSLPAFLESMLLTNCFGFNVTVPFKEHVAQYLADSKVLPSCNTLGRDGGRWKADSTDGAGFIEGLKEIDRSPSDFCKVIILGNGGAAKALTEALLGNNPRLTFSILRRDAARDHTWPSDKRLDFHNFEPEILQALLKKQPEALVIQSTSAPLHGENLGSFAPVMKGCKGAFVDLVYGKPSALFAAAKEQKIPAQDGLPMLLHQALLSQQIWWGMKADVQVVRSILKEQIPCR